MAEYEIGPARRFEAARIASMSKSLVEDGLPWRYHPHAVANLMKKSETEVVVARLRGLVVAFAIMELYEEEAHLILFAVSRLHRRRGLGRTLIEWLERMVETAMIGTVRLEVREANEGARAFYRELGYREVSVLRGYYEGRENAIRMERTVIPKLTENRRSI
jgi:ribosomal-protein-alanine N-acetyltransferase